MKRIVSVLVIFVLAAQYTSAASLRKRRQTDAAVEDTGVADALSTTERLPIVGGFITFRLTLTGDTASVVAVFANELFAPARILDGTLPCNIYYNGITCNGLINRTNGAGPDGGTP